jgi:hypothetical protein
MTYLEVPFKPLQNTFSGSFGNSMLRSTVGLQPGGFYRRNQRRESGFITLSWVLKKSELVEFMAFYKQARQGLPFLMDLYFDNTDGAAEYRCFIVPGSFSMSVQSDKTFVSLSVEVLK